MHLYCHFNQLELIHVKCYTVEPQWFIQVDILLILHAHEQTSMFETVFTMGFTGNYQDVRVDGKQDQVCNKHRHIIYQSMADVITRDRQHSYSI